MTNRGIGYVDLDRKKKTPWEIDRQVTIDRAIMALTNQYTKQIVVCVVNGDDKVEMFRSADPAFMTKLGNLLVKLGSEEDV